MNEDHDDERLAIRDAWAELPPAHSAEKGPPWSCPDCPWVHHPHPVYGWAAHDTRAIEVHRTTLCPAVEKDIEALAKVIRPWTLCDDGGRFDHGSERAARAVLAAGYRRVNPPGAETDQSDTEQHTTSVLPSARGE